MRQLFLSKGKVFLQNVPIPQIGQNQVLVKVLYSFVSSGTELATIKTSEKSLFTKALNNLGQTKDKIIGAIKENGFEGTLSLIKSKLSSVTQLGYSCSGQIIAVGNKVQGFRIGDYVACAGSGFANHADLVVVPYNLIVRINKKDFLKQASLTTIGSIAMQGIRRANLQLGETVAIFGLGLIGQITAQLAKLAGCKVFAIDINQKRLDLGLKNGADFVFDPKNCDLKKEIDFLTSHYGVDNTIITASSSSGDIINSSMEITKRKGKVVLVGDVKLDFARDIFYEKEIDFLISCSYGPGRYDSSYEKDGIDYPYSYVRWTENRNMQLFVNLIEDQKINIDDLISAEFDFDQSEKAYQCLQDRDNIGVILGYNIDQNYLLEHNFINKNIVIPYQYPAKNIKVGFIGVGGFAKIKLLPALLKNSHVELTSFCDADNNNLVNVANQYKIKNIFSDYTKIISDHDINLVFIATPHRCHFQQAIDAMHSGKAVFVEKPAVVNFEEYKELKNFLDKNKDIVFSVDFNRSFAPFNLATKQVLNKRKNPIMLHYRMNAGYVPSNHWIQSFSNGGRIIGEACHIFELFCFLTDSRPITVSVESLNSSSKDVFESDNIMAQIGFDDGSCCSLIYTSVGNNAMSKERMEVFFDGKSIVMDDYKNLVGYGLPSSFNKTSKTQDKGHEKLISEFILSAKNRNYKNPITFERILDATYLSLVVDHLARKGGGFEILANFKE